MNTFFRTVTLLLLTAALSTSKAQTSYGELMLLESIEIEQTSLLSIQGHRDLSESVVQAKGLALSYQRSLSTLSDWGVHLEKNFENKSSIELELQNQGLAVAKEVDADWASHLFMSFTPIHSHLNILNSYTTKMKVNLKAGLGPAFYKDKNKAGNHWSTSTLFAIDFEIKASENISLTPALQLVYRDITSSDSRTSRSRVAMSIGYHFK